MLLAESQGGGAPLRTWDTFPQGDSPGDICCHRRWGLYAVPLPSLDRALAMGLGGLFLIPESGITAVLPWGLSVL